MEDRFATNAQSRGQNVRLVIQAKESISSFSKNLGRYFNRGRPCFCLYMDIIAAAMMGTDTTTSIIMYTSKNKSVFVILFKQFYFKGIYYIHHQ